MKTFLYYCRGVVAIMFLSSAFVLAQVESGQIAGTVADQSGAIITGNPSSGAGVYLVSDLSSGVTGEVHHVDCGFHIVGMKHPNAPDIALAEG